MINSQQEVDCGVRPLKMGLGQLSSIVLDLYKTSRQLTKQATTI